MVMLARMVVMLLMLVRTMVMGMFMVSDGGRSTRKRTRSGRKSEGELKSHRVDFGLGMVLS